MSTIFVFRKLLLYLYFFTRSAEGGLLMLNAWYLSWPKEYLLFTVHVPAALVGGHLAFNMGVNAFISDISHPSQRSFRIAMVYFAATIGYPAGTKLGTYLYGQGGYLCVFGTSTAGRFVGAVFLVIRLEMFKWNPKPNDEENLAKPNNKSASRTSRTPSPPRSRRETTISATTCSATAPSFFCSSLPDRVSM